MYCEMDFCLLKKFIFRPVIVQSRLRPREPVSREPYDGVADFKSANASLDPSSHAMRQHQAPREDDSPQAKPNPT